MQLTPLKFPTGLYQPGPWYQTGVYYTHCGRFQINRRRGAWDIQSPVDIWYRGWQLWLRDHRLLYEQFATRRDALDALAMTLNTDGLMDVASLE